MDPTIYPSQDSTVCAPIIGAIGTIASAAGSFASQSAATAASNKAAINNYKYQVAQRENNWKQELNAWGHKKLEYEAKVYENQVAANSGYAQEQQKLNEIYNQAAFANQDQTAKLLTTLGGNVAAGRSGKSAQRSMDMMLAAVGRQQAQTSASLTSAQHAYEANVEGIRNQLASENNKAFSSVALKPVAGVAPPPPVMQSGPSPLGLIGSIASAGAGAIGGMQANQPPPVFSGQTPATQMTQAPASFQAPQSWTPITSLSPTFYGSNPYAL